MLLLVFKRKNVLQTQAHARNRLTCFKKFFFFFKKLKEQNKVQKSASNCLSKTSFCSRKGRVWTSTATDKALCGVSYFLWEWCKPTKGLY